MFQTQLTKHNNFLNTVYHLVFYTRYTVCWERTLEIKFLNRVFLNKGFSIRSPTCCSVTPKDYILLLAELRQERILPPGRIFFVRKKRRKQLDKFSNVKRKKTANEFHNCSVFYLYKVYQTLDITWWSLIFFVREIVLYIVLFLWKITVFYKGRNRYAVDYKSEQTKLNLFTVWLNNSPY